MLILASRLKLKEAPLVIIISRCPVSHCPRLEKEYISEHDNEIRGIFDIH